MKMSTLGIAVAAAALGVPAAPRIPEGSRLPGGVDPDPAKRPDIPDRVSIEQDSPYFFEGYPMLNVRINGRDSNQVVEYCKSEGWARLCLRDGRGKMKRDRRGKPITTTVSGLIQPYWRDYPIPDVAVVRPAEEVLAERRDPDWRPPEISREQARRLRQKAVREAKAAARGS